MKVILTKDVDTLGGNGDIINVAEGFARNFLFPKRLAILATDGSLKDLASRIEQIRKQAEKKLKEDQDKASKVEEIGMLILEANAGDSGKLFGTITTKELARVLNEKSGLEIERKQINVNAPINHIGEYEVYVKFSAKVSATIPIRVEAIEDESARYNNSDED